ncbi:flagellar hook-length control protein FliK [Massilia sp. TN1-12]|uniref:flagellar hook-length control protein FliK n=1 Tax=Massilia paldalensis TaxID=3377675 RepID=UPI00384DF66D
MMLSNFTSSTPAGPAQAASGAQPAAGAANTDSAGNASTAAGAQPPQPFTQWLGQQAGAQALQAALATAADATTAGAAPAAADGHEATDDAADDAAAPAPDNALLAAMAMPLMPLPAAQVAQALQAAQGSQAGARDADAGSDAPAAAGKDGARAAQPQLAAVQAATTATAALAAGAPATPTPAPVQPAAPQAAQQDGSTALRVAVHVDAGNAGGADAKEGGADHAGTQAAAAPLVGAAVGGSAPTQAAADTVKLSGPPTAWRQSLQEALGERLNVQVGKNVEQAVIRLEPPQLGRIDIAIRHSAGTLEVNISASNGEVLRQLQTVSDNLRSDLSQRQYTEVAVTVTPAPKNGAAPFGDPQQQGRGRQQGRDQDDTAPGRALAEASTNASAFTLGGRDS